MAFSGKATYDNSAQIGEDVSDIMLLISPNETPFLDVLPPPLTPATNIYHQWGEEKLGPDRLIVSTAVNSATAATGVTINGFGNQLQRGMLVELEAESGAQEVARISSIAGPNSILLDRNIGGSGVNSLPVGGKIFIISTAEEEGSETTGDVHRPRSRRFNYTQIFKKPILISGTDQAVVTAPPIGSEFDHQVTLRSIELARDLEKAVLRSVSLNTIGGDDQMRTMDGLRRFITSINSTVAANSFAADPMLYINDQLQQAWNAGARDLNVLLVGDQWARDISNTNASRLQVTQDERGIERLVEFITTDFGQLRKVLSPWMPSYAMSGVATRRVRVVPLRGRSFQRELLAKTGDSSKAHVLGEYTLEVHDPTTMFWTRRS